MCDSKEADFFPVNMQEHRSPIAAIFQSNPVFMKMLVE